MNGSGYRAKPRRGPGRGFWNVTRVRVAVLGDRSWPLGTSLWPSSPSAVPVRLPQIVGGAGEQPLPFARGEATPGHHGEFLAGLELPGHRFRGAGPPLVVLPAAVMLQAPAGAGGGRILVQVPGPRRNAPARPAGVFGQRRQEPRRAGVGAGEVLLADVPGIGEHGAQLRADAGLGSAAGGRCPARDAAGSCRPGAGIASHPR
jgi:hypothetical protein